MAGRRDLPYVVIDLLENTARNIKAQPVNLGGLAGVGGGVGGPPGGFIGWLPQTRVAYDVDEFAVATTSGSGTLLDNLNHIRYRIEQLESISGILVVDDVDGVPSISPTYRITFSGATLTDLGEGRVLVAIAASGGSGTPLTVEEADGSPSVNNVDKIIFSGATVTDLGNGDVRVTISGGGISGGDSTYLRLDATNDPITGPLVIDTSSSVDYEYALRIINNDTIHQGGGLYVENYSPGGNGLYIYQEQGKSLGIEQVSVLNQQVDQPLGYFTRYAFGATTAEFNLPIFKFVDYPSDSIVFSKGLLEHSYNEVTDLAIINSYIPTSSGVMVYFNSLNEIDSTGKLFSLGNNDIEKFYITGSGVVNIPTGATYNINGSPHTHTTGGAAPHRPGGRLTLATGTPITTTDQSAKATIYYTPYNGDLVPIYNGNWSEISFTELSLALDSNSGHTGYHQSGKNFDLFIYSDSGTLRLVSGPAWTNDTTRATALERVNGILMNAASMTARFGSSSGNTVTVAQDRGTFVGTFRASADGQTQVTTLNILLSNYYNREKATIIIKESTDFWSTTDTTWHSWNGSTANRVNVIFPDTAIPIELYFAFGTQEPAGWAAFGGIGLDTTSANSSQIGGPPTVAAAGNIVPGFSIYRGYPGLGFHYLQLVEKAAGSGTTYFYGDQGLPSDLQFGATGWVDF